MLKKLLMGIPKKILIVTGIFTLLWGLMNAYLTVALAKVTAAGFEDRKFIAPVLFFIAYILIWEMMEFICDYGYSIQQVYIRNASYEYYFRRLYTTRPEELQKGNTGYVAGILTQLIERKITILFSLLLAAISGIYIVYMIFYIAIYSPWFSLAITVLTLIGIWIRMECSDRIGEALNAMIRVKGEQTRVFMDGIHNIATVQKLRGLEFMEQKAQHIQKENLTAMARYAFGNEVGFTLYKTVSYMVCPICMLIAWEIYSRDKNFPIVEFMAYLSIITVQLVHNGKNLASAIKDYELFSSSQKEMDHIVESQSETYTSTSIGSSFSEISIQGISYHYRKEEEKVTISIPEFHIKKGEKICLEGESGQGKTTLLKILTGMIETKQPILVDGKAVNYNIDAVYIAQDTEMFDMTLRENLTFGNSSISDEQLISMLDAVGMKEWLLQQPEGLDTLLGERGIFVSTGQRQRLNVIRGLLIDKEIYLLDEPTSNVDAQTEQKMSELIKKTLQHKTVLIVTHKTKLEELCDRRYRFRDNCIQEISSV